MSDPISQALAHLDDAEASIMSFIARLAEIPPDDLAQDAPDALPMIMAVMRSVGRAAGALGTMNHD